MWINVNGIKMYYEVHGIGRPLIMVHGNSEDHSIFYDSRVLLSRHFTVYTVDSRGHGHSTRVEELHYSDMAEDMIAFMDQLDLRDVVFYGFSDGGIIGLLAAARCDRITSLIVSGANLTPRGVKPWLRLMLRCMYLFRRDPKVRLMLREPDIPDSLLKSISARTLVLAGGKDLVVEKETRRIAAVIPGAKLNILPGEGHGTYIVHSERIGKLISDFLC